MTSVAVSALLAVSMGLAGCAATGGGSRAISKADLETDACRAYLSPLVALNDQVQDRMNQSVATGAVVGGLLGGLTAAAVGGNDTEIAAGVVAGGVAGGYVGYLEGKKQVAADQNARRAAIEADAYDEYQRMSGVGQMIQNLGQCRRAQIAQVASAYKAKTITADQARAQAADIDRRMLNDDTQIAALVGRGAGNVEVYADAVAADTGSNRQAVLGNVSSYRGEAAAPAKQGKKATKKKTPKTQNKIQERYVQQKDLEATQASEKAETKKEMAQLQTLVAI
jgi:outer membrane lipoprotein SlyB